MREKQENDDARMQKYTDQKAQRQLARIQTIAKLADKRSRFEADFGPTDNQKAVREIQWLVVPQRETTWQSESCMIERS
jgi:hypothetical protein